MWKNSHIIVDDIFQGFSDGNDAVLTRTELYNKLLKNEVDLENVNFILGQGINELDLRNMLRSLDVDTSKFTFANENKYVKASQNNTHKHYFQNILVSVARRLENKTYEMDLMLDGGNEFFSDHMTGQHVQGMAIIEAARQAFLSVTEQFYLASKDEKFYFVINDINIKYKRFVFPVASTIQYTILEERLTDDRMSFDVCVDVIQDGKICANTLVSFTVFEYNTIDEKEKRAAAKVVSSLLEQHSTTVLDKELA
ncbi:AfsA-related hotdog domain-containing protein [Pseudoalteromonas xiamenensis]